MQMLRAYVECGHWPWRQVAGEGPLGLMVRHGGRDFVDELLDGGFTLTMRANPFPLVTSGKGGNGLATATNSLMKSSGANQKWIQGLAGFKL